MAYPGLNKNKKRICWYCHQEVPHKKIPCQRCGKILLRPTIRKATCRECIRKRQKETMFKRHRRVHPIMPVRLTCHKCGTDIVRKRKVKKPTCQECVYKRVLEQSRTRAKRKSRKKYVDFNARWKIPTGTYKKKGTPR